MPEDQTQTAIGGAIRPRYASPAELATYSSLSLPTIRRWIRLGQLRAFKVGGRILIDLDEFDAMVRASEIAAG